MTANFFQLLGITTHRGQTFLEEEDQPRGNKVALVSHSLWQRRFGGDPRLVGTDILLYGVLSCVVAQRTQEIGIRMALGAQRQHVLRMVVGDGMRLAVIGVVIGLAVSLGLTRLMSSLLFGVSATDPLTFAIVPAVLIIVALAACSVPARRAIKTDPLVALRYE